MKHGYQAQYDRLIFFILTGMRPRYKTATTHEWRQLTRGELRFDSKTDVIVTPELFKLIGALPQAAIFTVEQLLARSVIGESFVDVEGLLVANVIVNLNTRRNTEDIQDVFVETRGTKNLARTFAHPVLFFRRTIESLGRTKLCGPNDFLRRVGVPTLPFPDFSPFSSQSTINDVENAASALTAQLQPVRDLLSKYEVWRKETPPFPIERGHEAFYEQNRWSLQNVGWQSKRRLADRLDELSAMRKRVLILTGRAGQGKTNFSV